MFGIPDLPFFNGIVLGLTLSILLGPVFFALIHTSISKGFREGAYMAMGIVLSDATYLAIAYFLSVELTRNTLMQKYLGYAGALLLVVYGFYLIFNHHFNLKKEEEEEKKVKKFGSSFVRGYLLNFINVNVFFFWLVAISSVSGKYDSKLDVVFFFLGTLSTVFATDLLKAYLSKQLQRWVTESRIVMMNRVVGVILLVFGIYVFYSVWSGKNFMKAQESRMMEQVEGN